MCAARVWMAVFTRAAVAMVCSIRACASHPIECPRRFGHRGNPFPFVPHSALSVAVCPGSLRQLCDALPMLGLGRIQLRWVLIVLPLQRLLKRILCQPLTFPVIRSLTCRLRLLIPLRSFPLPQSMPSSL